MHPRKRAPIGGSRATRRAGAATGAAAAAATRVGADDAAGAIDSVDQADVAPRHGWNPERLDIERANERPFGSIEAAPGKTEAGGIEAPEGLRDRGGDKATPFE